MKAEAEAERKKRAAILDSEGVRQACARLGLGLIWRQAQSHRAEGWGQG